MTLKWYVVIAGIQTRVLYTVVRYVQGPFDSASLRSYAYTPLRRYLLLPSCALVAP